ncbi:MAG TPA: hypothetical protein VE641_13915 [Chthoniobacterales bacterium]|nr:hypothetical protein [Chthoniobacterales bacterium]
MTKLRKLLTAVIDGRTVNRAEHSVGHIGRTRDLEKMSAREAGEGFAVHSSQFTVHNLRWFAVSGGLFVVYGGSIGSLGWDL